jgi:predicted dehydrogenase
MIAAESPDLLAVCTPSGLHAEGVIAAARAGVRNIVVEKPMALRLEDADAMIAACAESGARLFVVKQNRYNLPIKKLRTPWKRGGSASSCWAPSACAGAGGRTTTTRRPGGAPGRWTEACSPTRPRTTSTCSLS